MKAAGSVRETRGLCTASARVGVGLTTESRGAGLEGPTDEEAGGARWDGMVEAVGVTGNEDTTFACGLVFSGPGSGGALPFLRSTNKLDCDPLRLIDVFLRGEFWTAVPRLRTDGQYLTSAETSDSSTGPNNASWWVIICSTTIILSFVLPISVRVGSSAPASDDAGGLIIVGPKTMPRFDGAILLTFW